MNKTAIFSYAGGLMAALLLPSPISVNAAEQSNLRGYLLAGSCTACHGPDGRSPDAIPALYGRDKDYIATALKAFKSGQRSATMMNRLAKGYSDDEIDLIATWFAAQE